MTSDYEKAWKRNDSVNHQLHSI